METNFSSLTSCAEDTSREDLFPNKSENRLS